MPFKNWIRAFMCARLNIKVSQCIAKQKAFYLVSGRKSYLECKKCTRAIKLVV